MTFGQRKYQLFIFIKLFLKSHKKNQVTPQKAKTTKPVDSFRSVSFESLLKGGWYFPDW